MVRIFLMISFLSGGLAFAQTEPENYSPFGECANYYYGVGVPQCYAKAFACFQKADDDIWLILMTLNGEGTPQSVKKARELLTGAENKNKPAWRDSQWLAGAENAVEEREKDPASLKDRFSICDFAGGTNDTASCWRQYASTMGVKSDAEIKAVEAKLSPPAKATLAALEDMFGKFQEADGDWMDQENVEGVNHGEFAQLQMILDRSDFASLIRKIVKEHGLQRRTEQEFETRDKELNSAYRQRIEEITNDYDSRLKDPDFRDRWPDIRAERTKYLESAREAQRLWIKLQEPWKKLCQELYRGEMPPQDIDRAIETELREARTQEIQCEDHCQKDFFGTPLFFRQGGS